MLLEIVVPSLFWREKEHLAYDGLRTSSLETLLSKGEAGARSVQTLEAYACQAFQVERQHDWPLAPLSALADGLNPGSGYWLRADPVHLEVDRDRLVLADASQFALAKEESAALAEALNRHFNADGICFSAPQPARWYVCLPSPPELVTTPIGEVRGRSIMHWLPAGSHAPRWRSIQNEAQMVLYNHRVNDAREARGEHTINSVWFWGGGTLPGATRSPYSHVWSNLPWLHGLARLAGTQFAALPRSLAELRLANADSTVLIVIDTLETPADYGDLPGWREALQHLEQAYFSAALTLVKERKLSQVSITTFMEGGGRSWIIHANDVWRFWRGRKSLAALV